MSAPMVGRLLKDTIYLTVKLGRGHDFSHHAPAGSAVLWTGQTNAGHESSYGHHLYWASLPMYSSEKIGLRPDIDFEWVDQASEFAIRAAASEVFEPEGVEQWMDTPHKWLDGRTPTQAAADGDGKVVRDRIESIAEGVPL